jgi:ribose transport system substrate-binding protein
MKRITWVLAVSILTLFLLGPMAAFAGNPPYKVALSMSYIGNDWQGISANVLTSMWELKYKSQVSALDVYVAGTDAANQNRQILQMIAKGYDMIICYPISPTALNNSIKKATDAGIVFIAYDSEVTAPSAYNLTFDNYDAAVKSTEWLAKQLNYKGNIVVINGVPGTTVDTDRRKGCGDVIAKYPGMKIVAEFPGMWANGPSKEGMAKILAAGIPFDGIFTQGGGAGTVQALQDAHHKLVPMGNESENMVRLMMMDPSLKDQGFSACSYGSPLYQGAASLYYGLKILQGDKSVPKRIVVPYPFVLSPGDTYKPAGDLSRLSAQPLKLTKTGSAEDLAAGANVFSPELVGPGFFANIYNPIYTPGLDLTMALTGRATQK